MILKKFNSNFLKKMSPQNQIPNGWQKTTLREIGKVITGKTPSKNNPKDWGKILDFVTPSDFIGDNKYLSKVARKLSIEGKNRFQKLIIPKNSVIVTCIGSDMGKVAINKNDCLTNQQINSIVVNNDFDVDFVYYKLKNSYKTLKGLADGGSTMPILNKSTFERIPLLLPPLPEQKSISSILSSFDNKIELLREENKVLEEIGQTIFKEWFGKYKVDDALPEGWRVGKLVEICEITSGKRPKSINNKKINNYCIPLIGATKIMGYVEDYLFDNKTLIIGRVGTHGKVQRFNEKIFPSDNTLVIKSENFIFVYQILRYIDYEKINKGAVQPLITQTDINNYQIIIPNAELLSKFKNITNSVFDKIDENSFQISSLSQTRDELLPKLMSGKVRVKDL